MHQQRSHIHDGLKALTDKGVIAQVRESPNKLKAQAKSLLRKLRQHDVRLDLEGNVDYSRVRSKGLVKQLKAREELVRVTLMQADLEFEYPHKLEKIAVKADVMKMIEEEEDKLKFIG